MSQNNGQQTAEIFREESLDKITREFDADNCTITFEDDAEEEYKYVLSDLPELDQNLLKEHNLVAKWTFVVADETTEIMPVIARDVVAQSTPAELQNHIKNTVIEQAVALLVKHKYPNK